MCYDIIYDKFWEISGELCDIEVKYFQEHFLKGNGKIVWNDVFNGYVYN